MVWFFLRGADSTRPSAFQRTYALLWQYIGSWLVLVGITVAANNLQIAGGYFMIFYFAAIFVAVFISYLELFALPPKEKYASLIAEHDADSVQARHGSNPSTRPQTSIHESQHEEDDDATERTSLLRGDRQRTFNSGYGSHTRSIQASSDGDDHDHEFIPIGYPKPYRHEQPWSGKLPSWTWFFQFIILSGTVIVFLGQVGLLMTSTLYQTPADGSPVLNVYLFVAVLSVLLLAPVSPFIHRISWPIPTILFFIFAGTLIYNLLAFPFSDHSPLKVYFIQQVNLDTGINQVSLTGLPPYVESIAKSIPSAAGQTLNCTEPDYTARYGLKKCAWTGPPPNIRKNTGATSPPPSTWMRFNATRSKNSTSVRFNLAGRNTRGCRLLFDSPISHFQVAGYATDPRFPVIGSKGCKSIRLWTREWGGAWDVEVKWDKSVSANLTGRAVCLWSDANDPATIPAFLEVRRYMPTWSIATKLSDGLVEGYRDFKI
jgi:hypothetical protein